MKPKQAINFFILITLLILLLNCKEKTENQADQSDISSTETSRTGDQENEPEAISIINGASGSTISGNATFTQMDDASVKFSLSISNAKPGSHAVHLHENGDCSASDGTSAGGHWNPTNTKHGKRGTGEFHKGDITNMVVGEDGNGSVEMTIQGWSIGGAIHSDILNKAVIIHDGPDDFTSQPSGAAGSRVACGVIEKK